METSAARAFGSSGSQRPVRTTAPPARAVPAPNAPGIAPRAVGVALRACGSLWLWRLWHSNSPSLLLIVIALAIVLVNGAGIVSLLRAKATPTDFTASREVSGLDRAAIAGDLLLVAILLRSSPANALFPSLLYWPTVEAGLLLTVPEALAAILACVAAVLPISGGLQGLLQPGALREAVGTGTGCLLLLGSLRAIDRAEDLRRKLTMVQAEEAQRLHSAEHRVTYLASHDPLTGLFNRSEFQNVVTGQLELHRRQGGLTALLLLNPDRLRLVNEAYGHSAGDLLLQGMAARLVGAVRRNDCVGRASGGEFAVLLSEVQSSQEALDAAERISQEVSCMYELGANNACVTVGVGISLFPADGQTAEGLLTAAESALRGAKKTGSSQIRLHKPSAVRAETARPGLEADLRIALEKQQLVLHYQPQVNVELRSLIGLEALVRWQHPREGLLTPGRFVPMAEETGLIIPLTQWVLKEACRQNKAWQQSGLPAVPVAVNLSARQFEQKDVVPTVLHALQECGLEGRYLEIEITEGASMLDPEYAQTALRTLKEHGVEISLDDFGTGFSSLSYLQRFPFDTIKIDQSFVRTMDEQPGNAAIISSIISLASGLSRKVIAEGVETEKQLLMLRMRGCQQVQGYLFSKPAPAAEITQLLQHLRERGARRANAANSLDQSLVDALTRYSYPLPPAPRSIY